jgi:hypothetical protein
MKIVSFCAAVVFSCYVSISAIAANVVKNVTTDAEYETFAAAISAAQSGDRLELIADAELTADLTISEKKLEFSGGQYALKGNAYKITLLKKSSLTIIDGEVWDLLIYPGNYDNQSTASQLCINGGIFYSLRTYAYGTGIVYVSGGDFKYSNFYCYNKGKSSFSAGKFTECIFYVQNYQCEITMGAEGDVQNSIICDRCEFESLVAWNAAGLAANTTPRINVNQGVYNKCLFYTEHANGMGVNHNPAINIKGGDFSDSFFQAGITQCVSESVQYLISSGKSTINIFKGNFRGCAFSVSKLGKQEQNTVIKNSKAIIDVQGGTFDDKCVYGKYGDNTFITVDKEKVLSFPEYTEEEIASPFVIGGKAYSTFQAAYEDAQEGDVISLRSYYAQNEVITIDDLKTVKIDAKGNIFYGAGNNGRSLADSTIAKEGSRLILSNGLFIGLLMVSEVVTTGAEGRRLTSDELLRFLENPFIVLEDGFFWRSKFRNIWSGSAKAEGGRYVSCEFNCYNYSSFCLFGEEGVNPEFYACKMTIGAGYDNPNSKYRGNGFAVIKSGKYVKCDIAVFTAYDCKHEPYIDVYDGIFLFSNLKCLKKDTYQNQMPKMRIHGGHFLGGSFIEIGSQKDTWVDGVNYGNGRCDSDLVICGGRFSDRPTATIDPECNVYTSSSPGVIYKYQVAKPDWFTIKIR